MILSKDQILQADDLKREEVEIPEWGGSVYVRQLSGADGVAMLDMMRDENGDIDGKKMLAVTVAYTTCDANGNLLFTTEDIESIGKKSAAALKRIFEVSNKLNSVSEEEAGN